MTSKTRSILTLALVFGLVAGAAAYGSKIHERRKDWWEKFKELLTS